MRFRYLATLFAALALACPLTAQAGTGACGARFIAPTASSYSAVQSDDGTIVSPKNATGAGAGWAAASLPVALPSLDSVTSPWAICGTSDSNKAVVFNAPQLAAPVTPGLSQTAGGTISAVTYYVKITYVNVAGETAPSTEASQAVGNNDLLVVASPGAVGNATGYNVYVATGSGSETKQNASPIALGTNWTEPMGGLVSGAALPSTGTAPSAYILSGDQSLASLTVGSKNYEFVGLVSDGGNYRVTQSSTSSAKINGIDAGGGPGFRWEFPGGPGYQATVSDNGQTISADATSAGLAITLPSTTAIKQGWAIQVIGTTQGGSLTTNATAGGTMYLPNATVAASPYGFVAGSILTVNFDGASFRILPQGGMGVAGENSQFPGYLRGLGLSQAAVPATPYLQHWNAALAGVRAGTGRAQIWFLTDSTGAGIGAGTGSSGAATTDAYPKAFPAQLANLLTAAGVPATDNSLWSDQNVGPQGGNVAYTAYDTRLTLGANWAFFTNSDPTLGGDMLHYTPGAVNSAIFTPRGPFDTLVITYLNQTGTGKGSFHANIDGGSSAGDIDTSVSDSVQSVSYTIPLGVHAINLVPNNDGDFFILGIQTYNSTIPGVDIMRASHGGGVAATFTPNSDPWDPQQVLANAISPNLCVVDVTVNDSNAGTAIAGYIASMRTIITGCQNRGADVILMVGPPSNTAQATNGMLDVYIAALRQLAQQYNLPPVVDMKRRWGGYANIHSMMPYFDNLHPGVQGYWDMADALMSALGVHGPVQLAGCPTGFAAGPGGCTWTQWGNSAGTTTGFVFAGLANNEYDLKCDVQPVTTGASFLLQFGEGATPTWEVGPGFTTGYRFTGSEISDAGTTSHLESTSAGAITIGVGATSVSGAMTHSHVLLHNLATAGVYHTVDIDANYYDTNLHRYIGGGNFSADSNVITAFRIAFDGSAMLGGGGNSVTAASRCTLGVVR